MEPQGDDWVSLALAPVARLAHADSRLSSYYPFMSMYRLCFARSPRWWQHADTLDLPSLFVSRDGTFGVSRRAYPIEGSEDPYGSIGEYSDPATAVAVLAAEAASVESRRGPS
jgi:hypothetical protein